MDQSRQRPNWRPRPGVSRLGPVRRARRRCESGLVPPRARPGWGWVCGACAFAPSAAPPAAPANEIPCPGTCALKRARLPFTAPSQHFACRPARSDRQRHLWQPDSRIRNCGVRRDQQAHSDSPCHTGSRDVCLESGRRERVAAACEEGPSARCDPDVREALIG